MKKNKKKSIRIENRGKVDLEYLLETEKFINKVLELDKGKFNELSPKLFYILPQESLLDSEELGFEVTLLSNVFKGRLEIKKLVGSTSLNLTFNKRLSEKGGFKYIFYKEETDVLFEELNNKLSFIITGESIFCKKDSVVLLKNGFIGIIFKYYSDEKIGIIYDEDSKEVEEYIKRENIEKILKNGNGH